MVAIVLDIGATTKTKQGKEEEKEGGEDNSAEDEKDEKSTTIKWGKDKGRNKAWKS